MLTYLFRFGIPLVFLLVAASFGRAEDQSGTSKDSQSLKLPEMAVIEAHEKVPPPDWALMQRHLIKTMDEAAEVYLRKFARRGGTLKQGGKVDDDYESFGNWALHYAIGGDEKVFDWALQQWSAITRHWTYERGSVHKEFVKHYDMLHTSEGYVGFQYFGLADPTIPENVERARRFAGFYLGEDPDAPNYDPKYKILRSPYTGSQGASFHEDPTYMLNYGHASLYPFVEQLEPGWDKDEKRFGEIQELYDQVVARGDVVINLAVTGLVTHAYLNTGDEKYKRWVLEYVEAWMQRIRENNGIIPDNVGPTGKIGEHRKGQWWGGFFGWSSRYSIEIMFNALITAAECAHLVSGDPKYLDLLRSQVDALLGRSKIVRGTLVVPYKYGPQGWYDYRPLEPHILSHPWHASMDTKDWDRIERVRKASGSGPGPYARAESPTPPAPGSEVWVPDGIPVDWRHVRTDLIARNQHRHNEPPHLLYLAGQNPEWPENVLRAEYRLVQRALDRIRSGDFRHKWRSQTVATQNPVFTNGLAQMTTGAPHPSFNGGLLRARVRYFNPDRLRPGLPPDVAALVEKLTADRVVLRLVNLSAMYPRKLIIQAGAFGEHSFTEARILGWSAEESPPQSGRAQPVSIGGKHFIVQLPPATGIRLDLGTRRFVNQPTYAFPWHRDGMPVK